jgi:hypothetical protein
MILVSIPVSYLNGITNPGLSVIFQETNYSSFGFGSGKYQT